MNRIILIGNGFDLAHGLKTSYNDFIDDFWDKKTDIFKRIIRTRTIGVIQDNLLTRTPSGYRYNDNDIYADIVDFGFYFPIDAIAQCSSGFDEFYFVISQFRIKENENNLHFNNYFLERINIRQQFKNWVDIEEEYYNALIECYNDLDKTKKLNEDFQNIQDELEMYLAEQCKNDINKNLIIEQNIYSPLSLDDFINKPKYTTIDNFLFLNFNYTPTQELYYNDDFSLKSIHIHGELQNPENPIIFGYGDEIDDKYNMLERANNNECFSKIKSFKYSLTNNYKDMLRFINLDEYQVFVMGHSCGLSDRTLLNTLFEHENCKSIKIFYHKIDEKIDNYMDIYMNISRNFNKNDIMREIVVSKTNCVPLT